MLQRIAKSSSTSFGAAALAAALLTLAVAGAEAGAPVSGDEREQIMSRARAEHAERQRQNLLGGAAEAAERPDEAAHRQKELDDLSARLERAERRRSRGVAPVDEVAPRSGSGEVSTAPFDERSVSTDRVAVLLVMKPGNRGIRRFAKTADPVLCVDRSCYISRGSLAPAAEMSRTRALGVANTLGSRAGACRDSLGCIFRDVAIEGRSALVQPIDLRLIKHDRRETRSAAADRSCRVDRVGLICDGAIVASDYTVWLVPESVASRVGTTELETAVAGGLRSGVVLSARTR